MEARTFERIEIGLAVGFAVFALVTMIPPLLASGDLIATLRGGFVNPVATGFSVDTILCWFVLAVWVFHEARTQDVRGGWLCLLLGLMPGVATGFAAYLVLRSRQSA